MRKIITLCAMVFTYITAKAQEPEMAEAFRKEGKIYVVITVAAIVLLGIFIYLISLDRKINRLKNMNKDSK